MNKPRKWHVFFCLSSPGFFRLGIPKKSCVQKGERRQCGKRRITGSQHPLHPYSVRPLTLHKPFTPALPILGR